MNRFSLKSILLVFILAVAVRVSILVLLPHNPEGVFQPDSKMYISLAQGVLQHGRFAYADSPQAADVERLPGYPFFLAGIWRIFGPGFMTVLWIQVLIDSLSCVGVYLIAEKFSGKTGCLAGVFAALNLSMITYAFFILSDSLFLFVFLTVLFCLKQALDDGDPRALAASGIGLGLATLIRPVSMYLPFFLVLFFILHIGQRGQKTRLVAFAKALAIPAGFFVVVFPWAVRNYLLENRLKLTSQYGEQLLQYVVPAVWEHSRGVPFIEGLKRANKEFQDAAQKQGYDLKVLRPFEKADLQTQWALKTLKTEPKSAVIKAWAFGMAKNLLAPALVDFSYLFNVERPHFFYTKGKNIFDRLFNFIKGMKGAFSWFLLLSLPFVAIVRAVQLWGLSRLFHAEPWAGWLATLIIVYFLLVSGPIGYAKYRLPFEPVLMVLGAVGLRDLYQRWRKKCPPLSGSGKSF